MVDLSSREQYHQIIALHNVQSHFLGLQVSDELISARKCFPQNVPGDLAHALPDGLIGVLAVNTSRLSSFCSVSLGEISYLIPCLNLTLGAGLVPRITCCAHRGTLGIVFVFQQHFCRTGLFMANVTFPDIS